MTKALCCARFVYNYFLNLAIDKYNRTGKELSYEDQAELLVALKQHPDHEWLKEVPSQILQQSLLNLRAAYTNFFKKRAKFHRFKKKHKKQSIRFSQGIRVESDYFYSQHWLGEGQFSSSHRRQNKIHDRFENKDREIFCFASFVK